MPMLGRRQKYRTGIGAATTSGGSSYVTGAKGRLNLAGTNEYPGASGGRFPKKRSKRPGGSGFDWDGGTVWEKSISEEKLPALPPSEMRRGVIQTILLGGNSGSPVPFRRKAGT